MNASEPSDVVGADRAVGIVKRPFEAFGDVARVGAGQAARKAAFARMSDEKDAIAIQLELARPVQPHTRFAHRNPAHASADVNAIRRGLVKLNLSQVRQTLGCTRQSDRSAA